MDGPRKMKAPRITEAQKPLHSEENSDLAVVPAHLISVIGGMPEKKSHYRRRAGSGLYLPADIKAWINSAILQMRSQWPYHPLEQAHLKMRFYVNNGRADLDAKVTTALDCLVKAGVIRNDSIAHLKHFEAEAILTARDDRCEIEVEEI